MFVLLFDIDGTLLDTGGAGQAAMERALETAFGVTQPTEGIAAAGRTDRAITRDLFAYHGIEETPEIWATFQETYFGHLREVLPQLDGAVLPGVESLLAQFGDRDDVTLGLLTGNFRHAADLKLQHFGLDHHFETGESGVCGGFGDSHPDRNDVARLARTAIEEHRQTPCDEDRLWVIGDTPHDVTCARAIGAKVVAVATGHFTVDQLRKTSPEFVFEDLSNPDNWLTVLANC